MLMQRLRYWVNMLDFVKSLGFSMKQLSLLKRSKKDKMNFLK